MSTNLPPAILSYRHSTWKPLVEDSDGSVFDSKFSGLPYLPEVEEYPRCRNCQKPLQMFVQLNLDQLPAPLRGEYGSGLLQMFYCISEEPFCEVECNAFFPFAKSVLVRIIEPQSGAAVLKELPFESTFPAKQIIGWEELDDYPHPEEAGSLGLELTDDEWDWLGEEGFPRTGDKLAGYPAWVQGVEYPECPACGETMRFVFQIDSEDNLPFMFGDAGCGHITQCKKHLEQLAFGWACG